MEEQHTYRREFADKDYGMVNQYCAIMKNRGFETTVESKIIPSLDGSMVWWYVTFKATRAEYMLLCLLDKNPATRMD